MLSVSIWLVLLTCVGHLFLCRSLRADSHVPAIIEDTNLTAEDSNT